MLNPRQNLMPPPKSELCAWPALLMPGPAAGRASVRVTAVDQQELSTERLVDQCKTGCRESFAALMERHQPRVFNFLCQLSGNRHDAEDLTQETFLKVFQNIHRFQSSHAFTTWLFTIAKRTAYNHFRSTKRFQELSTEEEIDWNDPARLLEEQDEKTSLWKLARVLKPDQYEALWLRYGEGFSIEETAGILRTNQIRVRVLLHRARKHLAKTLRVRQHSNQNK